jgi:Fic family protein
MASIVSSLLAIMRRASNARRSSMMRLADLGRRTIIRGKACSAVAFFRENCGNDRRPTQKKQGRRPSNPLHNGEGWTAGPSPPRVAAELEAFLAWFNAPVTTDQVIKAALARLWFVTIHPFEDGNGRIARAIADLALARSEGSSQRFYSMSAQIRAERNAYYDQLERTQKGGTDVTTWILWLLDCLARAIHGADRVLAAVVAKGQFWERAAALALNERQIKVLNRLLDGFESKMTSSKWAVIAKCSQDTANRDIAALLELGLLRKGEGGGRSTHYALVL